jgi:hypothetical protein
MAARVASLLDHGETTSVTQGKPIITKLPKSEAPSDYCTPDVFLSLLNEVFHHTSKLGNAPINKKRKSWSGEGKHTTEKKNDKMTWN